MLSLYLKIFLFSQSCGNILPIEGNPDITELTSIVVGDPDSADGTWTLVSVLPSRVATVWHTRPSRA